MRHIIKLFISCLILLQLLSCTAGAPYEIRSPCVSGSTEDSLAINPCIRKPLNINKDVA